MAIGWFLCQYKRSTGSTIPVRYCAIDEYSNLIKADGGAWSESEVLGNYAIVKVRATNEALTTIAAASGITRIPLTLLNDPMASLTQVQRTAIRNTIIDMGYTAEEITAALGTDLSPATLGDLLRFTARRRLKPRYEAATDTIFLDGETQPCRPIDDIDIAVKE
jgi:hypothetical protein